MRFSCELLTIFISRENFCEECDFQRPVEQQQQQNIYKHLPTLAVGLGFFTARYVYKLMEKESERFRRGPSPGTEILSATLLAIGHAEFPSISPELEGTG